MSVFLVRTEVDLTLNLSNESGYPQDAFSVRWTIFNQSGSQVSGRNLLAVKKSTGVYSAPWFADVINGNYLVKWEVQESSTSLPRIITQPLFVVDPSSYQTLSGTVPKNAIPTPGGQTLLVGTTTGRGDLPLFLKDQNGVPVNATSVAWIISDVAGNPITALTAASSTSLGEYFAAWFVNTFSGNYLITWQFQLDQNSPLQSATMNFSVVNPAQPFAFSIPESCNIPISDCFVGLSTFIPRILSSCSGVVVGAAPGGFPSISIVCQPTIASPNVSTQISSSSSSFEIPRIVHLPTQVLPASGGYTNQPIYLIPTTVRNIAFYITYTRGAPLGSSTFKLYWGNGVDEVQETIVGSSLVPPLTNMALQTLQSPVPIDNNPINFIFYTSIPGGAKTVRLLAAENGQLGNPGTVGITLTASTE